MLVHKGATVYLVTNEPCPGLWFAEMCYAADLLDLSGGRRRADYEENYSAYCQKAQALLDAGQTIGNADVCRELGHKATWGHRYWGAFLRDFGDALEGERKVRWKDDFVGS